MLTGIAHIQENLVLMLDVEKITQAISPTTTILSGEGLTVGVVDQRSHKRLIVAEDSSAIRSMICNTLSSGGYTQLEICQNGEEAWEKIQSDSSIDLIITDIEMPRLDGLRLTKLVKSDAKYSRLPVIIFSSIISDDNRNKGDAVGADEQISKPELRKLVTTVDKFLKIN
jgi:two-component system, chemotaxis family, chemotaxis protein CheV